MSLTKEWEAVWLSPQKNWGVIALSPNGKFLDYIIEASQEPIDEDSWQKDDSKRMCEMTLFNKINNGKAEAQEIAYYAKLQAVKRQHGIAMVTQFPENNAAVA